MVYPTIDSFDSLDSQTDNITFQGFFRVSQGPLEGPCPNGKCLHFFQFEQKKSQSEGHFYVNQYS